MNRLKQRLMFSTPKGVLNQMVFVPLTLMRDTIHWHHLYAAAGDVGKVNWCYDQLRTQPDYFTDKVFNNYLNIIGYLYQFGHRKLVPQVVARISSDYPANTPQTIYRDLIIRSGYLSPKFRVNFQISYAQIENGNFHLNLCWQTEISLGAIQEDYERSLESESAMYLKGISYAQCTSKEGRCMNINIVLIAAFQYPRTIWTVYLTKPGVIFHRLRKWTWRKG